MTDLITEARELCEGATDGPWEWTVSNDFGSELEAENLKGVIGLEDDYPGYPECGEHLIMNLSKADAAFIARSRTLIPELCDALEKAEAEIEKLKIYLAVSGTPIRNYDTVSTTTYPAPPAAEEGAERERN
jgi:hypothetical protein